MKVFFKFVIIGLHLSNNVQDYRNCKRTDRFNLVFNFNPINSFYLQEYCHRSWSSKGTCWYRQSCIRTFHRIWQGRSQHPAPEKYILGHVTCCCHGYDMSRDCLENMSRDCLENLSMLLSRFDKCRFQFFTSTFL